MQGESDRQRELLDVESVAGHLLEPGSVFALLAEHRGRLFPSELFADLFPSGRGRPSIPGEVIASVIVRAGLFQFWPTSNSSKNFPAGLGSMATLTLGLSPWR